MEFKILLLTESVWTRGMREAEAFDVEDLVEDVEYEVVRQTLELVLCFYFAHRSLSLYTGIADKFLSLS
ncbi:hypothetical protein RHMOL_Rhmol13G0280800 [Rhododendron molle]|uniref:Uncharacterized protein n=1 Tax=Rhododendron molle TaxID=49168 RepID=A0ACC0LCL5_RHOML|nr:hypothetical protein RHMOL_Rhmol13G0280800 [Rhododendron molle]